MKNSFGLFAVSLMIFISAVQSESNLLGFLSIFAFMVGVAVTADETWRMFLSMPPMNLNSFNVTSLSNLNVEIIYLHLNLNMQIDSYHFQLDTQNTFFGEIPNCSFC